jgi:hypothetical protein
MPRRLRSSSAHGVAHARIRSPPAIGDRPSHPVERVIDQSVQSVVQLAIFIIVELIHVVGDRRVAGCMSVAVRPLRCRLVEQVFVCGRRRRNERSAERVCRERVVALPTREQSDVVWIDEADHQQERTLRTRVASVPPGVSVGQPLSRPIGEDAVPAKTAVTEFASMRLGADPTREPKLVQHVGVEVRGYCDTSSTTPSSSLVASTVPSAARKSAWVRCHLPM